MSLLLLRVSLASVCYLVQLKCAHTRFHIRLREGGPYKYHYVATVNTLYSRLTTYSISEVSFPVGGGGSRTKQIPRPKCHIASQITLGIQVYKYYLRWAQKSANIAYIRLFGSLGLAQTNSVRLLQHDPPQKVKKSEAHRERTLRGPVQKHGTMGLGSRACMQGVRLRLVTIPRSRPHFGTPKNMKCSNIIYDQKGPIFLRTNHMPAGAIASSCFTHDHTLRCSVTTHGLQMLRWPRT